MSTPADRAALEIGRLFMRAHVAEQLAQEMAATIAGLKAKLAEATDAPDEAAAPDA